MHAATPNTITTVKLRVPPVKQHSKPVEDLWDSIAADRNVLPVTPEQRAELDRRLKAYEIDQNRGRTAADALDAVRRRL